MCWVRTNSKFSPVASMGTGLLITEHFLSSPAKCFVIKSYLFVIHIFYIPSKEVDVFLMYKMQIQLFTVKLLC
jgi:hypothetical protein